ncbi:hypothetical protein MS3_00003359 [Schistosoma haematobium]|uniref:Uncharacterized protein n=2 Tax=Schistosoma haematobium TaxID=6185 RepID=A0A922LPG1_SCHHA|nr:hypothetical protein MS3_00003359 [Schistosoma haematobium]KAH9590837.1 hypothetical protein MS3_00003359 [Schistosoma haematobium]CAH8662554.1 unnamed protein product [Schistosoma haematobium]
MSQADAVFPSLAFPESEILNNMILVGDAHFLTRLHNFEILSSEPVNITPSTSDYLQNEFKNLSLKFDHLYASTHKNLKVLQELDSELHSLDRTFTVDKRLESFAPLTDIKKGTNIRTIKYQTDLMMTLKEKDLNLLSLATGQDKFIHDELVRDIKTLRTRIKSIKNKPKRKQTMYCQEWYAQKLGRIVQNSSCVILRFNTNESQLAKSLVEKPLLRGFLKHGDFGTIALTNTRVIGCHDSIISLCECLTPNLTPSTIVACIQQHLRVDFILREDIKRLSSMYPLDWDPAARNLHLLAGQGVMATATIHIAPNGSISLVKIRKSSNPDHPNPHLAEPRNFVPPISWSLDEWLMEINDFCNSVIPTS